MNFQKRKKGFTLIELLIVIVIIGVLATVVLASLKESRLRAKNAAIVTTLSSLDAVVDASKYPGSLAAICDDFEPGGEFEGIRTGVEKNGGIWHCDSTFSDYRIYVKLNQEVVITRNNDLFGQPAFAQEEYSTVHIFGNYYCLNSDFKKTFTHWSGDNLSYPSCDDSTYSPVPEDPEPTPEPTPDPDPESDPEPPLENGGPVCNNPKKSQVCHFDKTLCISKKAVKAHKKHGDQEGVCA